MKTLYTMLFVMAWLLVDPAGAAAQKNKTTCGADVPLVVKVQGVKGNEAGLKVVSDGVGDGDGVIDSGVYTHGAERVEAHFQVDNCTHDFTMNLNRSSRSMFAYVFDGKELYPSKFFNFDRINSVPVTVVDGTTKSKEPGYTDRSSFEAWCEIGVRTDPATGKVVQNADGHYQDNYERCGNDQFGLFVRRIAVVNVGSDYYLSYRAPLRNTPAIPQEACDVDPSDPACQTQFIRVYHPDANTWILRPEGTSDAALRVWVSGGGATHLRAEVVPLEIVVTRKK